MWYAKINEIHLNENEIPRNPQIKSFRGALWGDFWINSARKTNISTKSSSGMD